MRWNISNILKAKEEWRLVDSIGLKYGNACNSSIPHCQQIVIDKVGHNIHCLSNWFPKSRFVIYYWMICHLGWAISLCNNMHLLYCNRFVWWIIHFQLNSDKEHLGNYFNSYFRFHRKMIENVYQIEGVLSNAMGSFNKKEKKSFLLFWSQSCSVWIRWAGSFQD